MAPEEKHWLARLAPALAQLSTLAWAGARHSAHGQQLLREGAVGRVQSGDAGLEVLVHAGDPGGEDQVVEIVTLSLAEQPAAAEPSLRCRCTCGAPRCAHAVAAVLAVQKRAKVQADSQRTQDSVMGALRQRLQVRSAATEERGALLDMQRLPLDAAVDMVALTWRQSLRPGAPELRDLEQITVRVVGEVVAQPELARLWALRLLTALGARKVVFTPLPEAAEAALLRLAGVFDYGDIQQEISSTLYDQALDGHAQVAPIVAHLLIRLASRQGGPRQAVAAQLLRWRAQQPHDLWKESGQPSGRDLLFSGMIELCLAYGDVSSAGELAMAWPPMRSALASVAAALGAAGQVEALIRLLGAYDPRGGIWQAGVDAGITAAAQGQLPAVAARLALWAFERQPVQTWLQWLHATCPPDEWHQRRLALLDKVLTWEDPEWLPAWLLQQPDAAAALLQAVTLAPQRDKAARGCLERLAVLDPLRALVGRQVRIRALIGSGPSATKGLRAEWLALAELADHLREPGLASDYRKLLVRELGEVAS